MYKTGRDYPFSFFSIVRLLFNFFTKGPHLQFFGVLRQNGWKISKRPPWCAISVQRLGFWDTVKENTWHFEVLLLFLILRYGADLGRSRLVWFIWWRHWWRHRLTSLLHWVAPSMRWALFSFCSISRRICSSSSLRMASLSSSDMPCPPTSPSSAPCAAIRAASDMPPPTNTKKTKKTTKQRF